MAEKKFDAQVNYGWGLSLNMTGKAPAIAKRIFDTYNDALGYANDFNDSAIPGLQLSVINDTDPEKNGIYFVSKTASAIGADDAELVLVNGSEGSGAIQVETYTDAIAAATGDNLGQIIYVTTETTSGDSTYIAGPYIVTGAGVVSFLSSSTPGATDEVAALKSRVDTIEGDVTTIKTTISELEADHENFVVKDGDKVLSDNNYTTGEKNKLEGIAEGAQVNVIETVKVNGVALEITEKTVDITIESPVYNDEIATTETDGVISVTNGENAPTSTAVYNYVETVKTSVNDLISDLEGKVNAIETWKLQVIPEEDASKDDFGLTEISHKTIYLVPNSSSVDKNIYDEYIYVNNQWEKLGEFKADFDATELQQSITELGAKVGTIETNLATLEASVEELSAKLDTVEATTNETKTATETNAEAIETLKTSVGGLVKDVTLNGTSIVADNVAALTLNEATAEANGLMSKEDKTKLDTIAEGAQVNVIESITVNGGETLTITEKNVNIVIESLSNDDIDNIITDNV